jgi:hypothetical protein
MVFETQSSLFFNNNKNIVTLTMKLKIAMKRKLSDKFIKSLLLGALNTRLTALAVHVFILVFIVMLVLSS